MVPIPHIRRIARMPSRIADLLMPVVARHATVWPSTHAVHGVLLKQIADVTGERDSIEAEYMRQHEVQCGVIDSLREQCAHKDHRWHEMRHERDGLRTSLDAALQREEALEQTITELHGRLDALARRVYYGDTEEAKELAEEWHTRR